MDKNDSYLNMEYIKKPDTLKNQGSGTFKERAADGNRTRDLRTTNATLYRLSHSSIFCSSEANLIYTIMGNSFCQRENEKKSKNFQERFSCFKISFVS